MVEIGKLENGKPDPCYDCSKSDTEACLKCENYNRYEALENKKQYRLGLDKVYSEMYNNGHE